VSEGVEILISADDQASKVLGNVAKNVDAKVKQIKEVGRGAKASTEFVGTLANSLGGSQFASYAAGIAQLSERIGNFSEVSKAGSAGALAFKAGLLGVAAVAGFKIGSMIGDWAFETEKWRKQLSEANELLKIAGEEISRTDSIKLSFRTEKAELLGEVESRKLLNQLTEEAFAIETQIKATKAAQLKDNEGLIGYARYLAGNSEIIKEANKEEIAISQNKLELINKEKDAIAAKLSPYKLEIEALKEANALKKQNDLYIKSLSDEVELLKQSKDTRAGIEALQKSGGDAQAAAKIETLLKEKDALLAVAEQEKKNQADAEKAMDKQIADAEKIANIRKDELTKLEEQRILLTQGKEAAAAFALEQNGLDKATAAKIAAEQTKLDTLGEKQKEQAPQSAVQGRLLTRGPGDDIAKQQLTVQQNMLAALGVIKQKLPLSTSTSIKYEVVGR